MKSFWVPPGYLLSYMGCSECLNSREEQTEKSIIKYTELNTWCWNTLLKSKKMHLALQQKWLESVWGKYHVCLSFTDAWSPTRGHCQRLQEDMGLPALSAWPKASLPMLYAAPWAAQKLLPPHLTQIRDKKQSRMANLWQTGTTNDLSNTHTRLQVLSPPSMYHKMWISGNESLQKHPV